jgi:hypothetical protein
VGRGHQHRVRADRRQAVHLDAVVVHRDRDGLKARGGHDGPLAGVAGILHGDPPGSAAAKRPAHQRRALGKARADQDLLGVGGHPPHPPQVADQRLPQRRLPTGVPVAEGRVRRLLQRLAQRRQPGRSREGLQRGDARAEVVADGLGRRGRAGRCGAYQGGIRHPGGRALPGHQVALGHQLVVGLHHHAPSDAKLLGQHPGGGQGAARRQPARADRLPQVPLELRSQGTRPAPDREEQLQRTTGPLLWHRTGP